MRKAHVLVDWIGAALLISMAAWIAWTVSQSGSEEPEPKADPVTLTATWTSGGVQHTVSTTQQEGEEQAAFEARHNDAVARQLAKYLPDTK